MKRFLKFFLGRKNNRNIAESAPKFHSDPSDLIVKRSETGEIEVDRNFSNKLRGCVNQKSKNRNSVSCLTRKQLAVDDSNQEEGSKCSRYLPLSGRWPHL